MTGLRTSIQLWRRRKKSSSPKRAGLGFRRRDRGPLRQHPLRRLRHGPPVRGRPAPHPAAPPRAHPRAPDDGDDPLRGPPRARPRRRRRTERRPRPRHRRRPAPAPEARSLGDFGWSRNEGRASRAVASLPSASGWVSSPRRSSPSATRPRSPPWAPTSPPATARRPRPGSSPGRASSVVFFDSLLLRGLDLRGDGVVDEVDGEEDDALAGDDARGPREGAVEEGLRALLGRDLLEAVGGGPARVASLLRRRFVSAAFARARFAGRGARARSSWPRWTACAS